MQFLQKTKVNQTYIFKKCTHVLHLIKTQTKFVQLKSYAKKILNSFFIYLSHFIFYFEI